ncbi:hypothetical protein BKA56DRAFT_719307 [Ilyonectria sp. MPI-CAGE-AT-0026]|nr:hypothetical protein BKA56DRAFT_719307 [Ilyonectria sp. MPI-CAGE-AT-0026]
MFSLRRWEFQSITSEARDCLYLGRSEAAWNLEVHGPLLNHVLAHQCVKSELFTTARIVTVPSTNIPGSSVESKMIDFVLVLALS